jgi:hypothetical protein
MYMGIAISLKSTSGPQRAVFFLGYHGQINITPPVTVNVRSTSMGMPGAAAPIANPTFRADDKGHVIE